MGKLELSHVKMMSSISLIKLVRNKSLVDIIVEVRHFDAVAPARERGLKSSTSELLAELPKVAPARERGLKCSIARVCNIDASRSRKGAWIEIAYVSQMSQ